MWCCIIVSSLFKKFPENRQQLLNLRLCLVHVKYFPENKYFSEMLFLGKENIFKCWLHYENCFRKYFYVFGNILKMLFSTTTHTTGKPPKHHHPHHHNNNKKNQRSKARGSIKITQKIKITQRERLVRGTKALGRQRSRRLVGRRLWVKDWFVGS